MRILIVGAGFAGLTLAALLRQRGIEPKVIERRTDLDHAGYMIGLYPLGSDILYGLGLHEKFLEKSVDTKFYTMRTGEGALINQYLVSDIFDKHGPFQIFQRGTFVRLLLDHCQGLNLKTGMTIKELHQDQDRVLVTFSDDTNEEFDLVVGADGMHSKVRQLAFSSDQISECHTGWGGWVWWAEDSALVKDESVEFWGEGSFLGIYPTGDKYGVIAASPTIDGKTQCYPGRAADIKKLFSQKLLNKYPTLFNALPDDSEDMFYWPLSDVRCKQWFNGRIALVGDAVVGFLPTAGIGASMAMESAAVLADELSRTNSQYLAHALNNYQIRRKRRAEGAQEDSRVLAKYMLVKSPLMSKLRNWVLKYYSIKALAKSIAKTFDQPI